ncbi:PREDICTED: uncharacterized protein LOC109177020 [Ipomoea nil]|uniref:uncharacterized protein LOC109177020 n=1 Tax=Ipomoea nil TaxID=35883 RepID=UPI000901760D|nr:PREDICTED: uncharacterized protein LOC109177020 [Ipomoea nil]
MEPITFALEDQPETGDTGMEALVVTIDIMGVDVQRVMVDTGSSVNVLYLDIFEKLKLDLRELTPVGAPLSGFTGDTIHPEGKIILPVELGTPPKSVRTQMEFVVVNLRCVHNVILGRPAIMRVGGIISMPHLCMKFPTSAGVGVLRGDAQSARKCYSRSVNRRDSGSSGVNTITKDAGKDRKEQPEPSEEIEEVPLSEDRPERKVKIGRALTPELRLEVLAILQEFADIFAWGPKDMPGIDCTVICHRLAVDPAAKPVKQKTKHLSSDRREFVREEVKKMAAIGHIHPVTYPEWVANIVLVPKPPYWRMCIDFTDLNKACPLDPYPLPSIHQMVDETAGAELMSFMDAFIGYHQIMMSHEDESKTSFVTPDGLYCYRVMPFGLRNAGATYQRMINMLFEDLLGGTMEAYIDDMLVKSRDRADHTRDLRQCFQIMRTYQLRLNPTKCTFAVQTGKFLGYMMTKRGIEPNPAKVKAILDMQPPTTVREVHQLTGRLAALSRFLSKLAERALPFFKVLRKVNGFTWDDECRSDFTNLKNYLMSPIVLSKPEPGEELDVYLGVSDRAPIGAVLRNASSSERLVKWALMLTHFAMEYRLRPAIKGQALADFLVECTARDTQPQSLENPEAAWWTLATDGSSRKKGAGGGVVVTSPEGFKVYYALMYQFTPTNNEAEYEAFINGLQFAQDLGADYIRAQTDSALVVRQVLGEYEVNGERLQSYRDLAMEKLNLFRAYAVQHVPRLDNADVDILSKLAQDAPKHISKIARILMIPRHSIHRLSVVPVQPAEET